MISLAEGDEGTVQRIFPSRLWQQKWCFPARFQVDAGDGLVVATVCCPWKLAPPSSLPLPSLGRKLLCEAQYFLCAIEWPGVKIGVALERHADEIRDRVL